MYNDPFRRGNNKLILCETYKYNREPTGENDVDITACVVIPAVVKAAMKVNV